MVAAMVRLALATIFTLLAGAAPALAANASVTASNFQFTPDDVTINAGEKLTFSNGGGTHNVDFADGQFQSPASPSSSAWVVERTFAGAGDYAYFCDLHGPDMSGTVHVVTPAKSYQWIGSNGGSWETDTNWSPTGVPGTSPTDAATIADGDTVLMGGNHTIASLTLANDSTRAGAGTLTLTGASTWTGGHADGGKTIVAATGQLTWSGGSLASGELENLGTLTVGGVQLGDSLPGADTPVLDNQGTATMNGSLTDASEGGARVQNPGALSGSGTLAPALSNSGTVTAQGGMLDLTGGSVTPNPGDYAAAANGTLRFSGTTIGEAGARVTGAGRIEIRGQLELPSGDAQSYAVAGTTDLSSVGRLFVGGGSTGRLDISLGAFRAALPFAVTGGPSTWSVANILDGPVTLQGPVSLGFVGVWGSTKLRTEGATTLNNITFGSAGIVADGAPELLIAGTATLAAANTYADHTGGGTPRVSVLAGGSLLLGTNQLTLEVPISMAGTLGVQLDGASAFGRLTAPSVALGGALAVSGAFKPADPLRVIASASEPTGSLASVTSGFEAVRDATGVLLKTAPVVQPTPTPTPTPTATATPAPAAAATPAPTVTPVPLPRFAALVKLPKCANRRAVRVTLLRSETVRVRLGRKQLKRATRSFTLKRLPKRAFTLKFEVTIPEGTVKASKRFRPCKK
jgi:plastocyanin